MPYENIDFRLETADIDSINENIRQINKRLPFLVNLTKKEKRARGNYAARNELFVITAFEIAESDASLVPQVLSMPQWENDIVLCEQLTLMHRQIKQLEESLSDTILALKTEKSKTASIFYNTLKVLQTSNAVAGIDAMIDKLRSLLRK